MQRYIYICINMTISSLRDETPIGTDIWQHRLGHQGPLFKGAHCIIVGWMLPTLLSAKAEPNSEPTLEQLLKRARRVITRRQWAITGS